MPQMLSDVCIGLQDWTGRQTGQFSTQTHATECGLELCGWNKEDLPRMAAYVVPILYILSRVLKAPKKCILQVILELLS